MSTLDKSQAKDFLLGNMADDLLDLTLNLCGRKDSSTPRFPRLLYDGYVSQIIEASVLIQKNIIIANELPRADKRKSLQEEASYTCVWLTHMIRVAGQNGWISSKQQEQWQKLVVNIKWKIISWMKSDNKFR